MVNVKFSWGHVRDILPNTRESILWRMQEFNEPYSVAREKVKAESVAGFKIWQILDDEFKNHG